MTFKDITLVGTSKIGNCYEVSGGKLALTNLKFNFKNNDRKISNFVSFNDIGGYLHVMNTQIKDISVGGIQPLFGDDRATEIKLTKCIFNNISNYDEYFNFNIVGQSDISVMDCSFIDVENALIGGIVNGLNQNGKLFVIGSSFYKCINARKEIRLNKDRESVISGDAIFQGSQWDECSSYNYGGALSFTSSGELTIRDCHFQQCLSVGGKGGSVYIVGQGLHQIRDCTFIGSISSYASIAEGGSLYIEGGINQLRSLIIESSKTEVSPSSDSSTSISRGGAIYATDWKNDSQIREIVIKDCESEQGAAINIESASSRIEIRDSTFQNNIALSQGGGAIFSQLDTLIQVKFTSFDHNIAYGNNKGSDLQFGGLGVSQDNVNWEQIRKDVITGCQSTSNEPRVQCHGGQY
ncbi:MAG: hypothetical protein EZS28_036141 [Streblomastix strix]|uniref:Right handed beta helix domain-containing protein n=1 Tax=Streblomastix strix TaxID=222440 RepID=A0A5J4UEG0_9EUKA|nr:MAG: hypothetical protein EZS28_036141 [Streblomastix strix]